MPHIKIYMYSGRPDEIKQQLTTAITEDITRILGLTDSTVSLSIEEVEKENWMTEIYDKCIVGDMDNLYKKPGYGSLVDQDQIII